MRKKIFKKIILGIFISLLILPFFVRPATAYETKGPYLFQFEEAIKSDEMNLQSFVNETMKAIAGSVAHFAFGFFIPGGSNQTSGLIPGTIGLMANLYASPPASGIQYFADIGKKMGVITPTYAQQEEKISGFKMMAATQPIWKVFRNITYVLFALVLVGMGFAIMFRVKISPQAVITIQSALPKIVIALIMITFSYAIVGLMIDVAYGIINITVSLFQSIFKDNLGGSWVNWWANTLPNSGFVHFLIPNAFDKNPMLQPLTNAFLTVGSAISVFFLFTVSIFTIFGIIANALISIIVLIAFLRCFWTLLKAFTMTVVNLVFAPFRLLAGVFPGSNAIGGWFKDLLANIAVLPMMIVIFYISSYFIFKGAPNAIYEVWHDWYKNLLPWTVEFSTDELIYILFPFVGLTLLLMAPKVSDMIQSFITKKPLEYGTAIGQAMGPVVGPIRGAYQTVRGGFEKKYQQDIADKVVPLVQNLPSRIFGKKAVPTPEIEQEIGKVGKD